MDDTGIEYLLRSYDKGATLKKAYEMGLDCGKNGATLTNCHFSLFATLEMTGEWERGKKDAEEMK